MRAWRVSVLVAAAAILGFAWLAQDRQNAAAAAPMPAGSSSSASAPLIEDGGTSTSTSLTRPFAGGGRITLDLSAGEYRIEGAPDNQIDIRWSVRDAGQLRHVRVRADVNGGDAHVTTDGPGDHFRVTIRVPTRADLHLRLSAGELSLRGIEGNKDVELNAGEIDIDIGRADDYSQVDGSVWAGEIQAPDFRISSGGLFRSFNWRGPGTYRLHTHLMAGEIHLRTTSAPPVER